MVVFGGAIGGNNFRKKKNKKIKKKLKLFSIQEIF
jgi:hypothetical protein